jgi:hypothetical protein
VAEKTTADEGEEQRIKIKELQDEFRQQIIQREQDLMGYTQTLHGLK